MIYKLEIDGDAASVDPAALYHYVRDHVAKFDQVIPHFVDAKQR